MEKRSGVQPYDTVPYRTCAWTDDLGPEIRVYRACYAHCITPLVNDTKMCGAVIYRIERITIIMCVYEYVYVYVCVSVSDHVIEKVVDKIKRKKRYYKLKVTQTLNKSYSSNKQCYSTERQLKANVHLFSNYIAH